MQYFLVCRFSARCGAPPTGVRSRSYGKYYSFLFADCKRGGLTLLSAEFKPFEIIAVEFGLDFFEFGLKFGGFVAEIHIEVGR